MLANVLPVPSRQLIAKTLVAFFSGRHRDQVGPGRVMKVVLAYEDLNSALGATEMLTVLFEKLAAKITPRLMAWNFAMLGNSRTRELATQAALDSDLIVVAASRAFSQIPFLIKSWLQSPSFNLGNPPAGVAVFEGELHGRASSAAPRPSAPIA